MLGVGVAGLEDFGAIQLLEPSGPASHAARAASMPMKPWCAEPLKPQTIALTMPLQAATVSLMNEIKINACTSYKTGQWLAHAKRRI